MFYKLSFDMERINSAIKDGTNTIFAEANNLNEIEYKDVKKGYFCYIISKGEKLEYWPKVEFFYSSQASNLESEYLLNSASWPIVHKKVQAKFDEIGIMGIQYLPITLVDTVTNGVNENYVVINILNVIEAYDLEKSKYKYNEKYNYYNFLPHEIFLDKSICSKYDIFRCLKSLAEIYISEKVKKVIEKNKWIGFEYYEQQ